LYYSAGAGYSLQLRRTASRTNLQRACLPKINNLSGRVSVAIPRPGTYTNQKILNNLTENLFRSEFFILNT
jgi:hypothetical protein